jgi:hypothetical protein
MADLLLLSGETTLCAQSWTLPEFIRLGLQQTPFFRGRDGKDCADGDENDGCREKGDGRTGDVGKQA